MNAKVCLLTHFSQRYPKIPHLGEALVPADGSKSALDVVLAFDMMRLRIGDAWKFRHYLPPLSALSQRVAVSARFSLTASEHNTSPCSNDLLGVAKPVLRMNYFTAPSPIITNSRDIRKEKI